MVKKPTINLIIVDDHDMFRDGIKSLLELDEIANVVAEASNGQDFLNILPNYNPDLVLMDIDMPEMNGVDATRKAVADNPSLKVLALSMFGDEKYYTEMIEAGAKGFILKSSNKSELENAIREVANGQTYFSNDLLRKIIANIGSVKTIDLEKSKLSFNEREIEILQLICMGFSTNEVAEKIFLSPKTVENYRIRLLNKVGCKNSVSLVVYAIKNKLVQI